MKKVLALLVLATLMAGTVLGQSAEPQKKGLGFGNPFSAVENFVEQAEVSLAGIIGGKDLKAKALANNAEEDLERAEKLSSRNQSDKAAKLIQKYEEKMNMSRELAKQGKDRNLSNKIENISSRNVQRLEEVKKKVPEEAQKGIQNAIENSQRKEKRVNPENKTSGNGKESNPANRTIKPGKKLKTADEKLNSSDKLSEKSEKVLNRSKDDNASAEKETVKEQSEDVGKELNNRSDSERSQANENPEDVGESEIESLQ